MLVLSRRVGEEIVIDGRIHVTFLGVQGSVIRLGVEAPSSVTVDREEVHLRRQPPEPQTDPKRDGLDAQEMNQLQEKRFTEWEPQLAKNVQLLVNRRFGTLSNRPNGVTDLELDAAEHELGAPLPQSYRAFLRSFGSRSTPEHKLFGLPRDRLWGDIVLMNHLDSTRSSSSVKFTEDADGRSYYFDTARMENGECPVIVQNRAGDKKEIAHGFLQFLTLAPLNAVECLVKA